MEERIDIKAVLHQAVDNLPENLVHPREIAQYLEAMLDVAYAHEYERQGKLVPHEEVMAKAWEIVSKCSGRQTLKSST